MSTSSDTWVHILFLLADGDEDIREIFRVRAQEEIVLGILCKECHSFGQVELKRVRIHGFVWLGSTCTYSKFFSSGKYMNP